MRLLQGKYLLLESCPPVRPFETGSILTTVVIRRKFSRILLELSIWEAEILVISLLLPAGSKVWHISLTKLINRLGAMLYFNRVAYVRQEDLFFSQLPVRETLSLAAELQLPKTWKSKARERYVEELLYRLGLVCFLTQFPWSVIRSNETHFWRCPLPPQYQPLPSWSILLFVTGTGSSFLPPIIGLPMSYNNIHNISILTPWLHLLCF